MRSFLPLILAVATMGATITPSNVAGLRVRWQVKLGAVADTAPLVVGTTLYITATDGTTYAVDTANGRILWRFATHGPKITTSVPAYDPATHALYVPGVDGMVHRLDPGNGREVREGGFPEQITLAPQTEKNASPLRVANGYLYAQTSGYVGDATPYVGHVVAIRLSDGSKHVFNVLCSSHHELIEPQTCAGQRAGMWSRAGVVVDPDASMHGRIYVATGNGPFDASAGDYGDSILSLNDDAATLIGYLTPPNHDELEADDLDVGSSSPAMLPRQPNSATPLMAVQGGKDSVLRLFDRAHLSGTYLPLQSIGLDHLLFSIPGVWTDGAGTTYVFIGITDGVHAYRLVTKNRVSRLVAAWHTALDLGREGASPIVGDGVLFLATSNQLLALDAQTGRQLWSSTAIGLIHWEIPVVAGDTVYCADYNGTLTAFSR
ncbi:MAG TPA: PQQ-binding-like beta-propeller repeat protein [Candidatus Baltobacteraceae bacterium]|nr:PQQ-binding-like beta-propeller repeat protein [Candidatus Baltobacteraceae bacterium]